MPEVEYVYEKATYHKILQAWNGTKTRFGHDRDILLRCREDAGKLQLVPYVHAESLEFVHVYLRIPKDYGFLVSVYVLSAASKNYIEILPWTMQPLENWLNS